MDILTDIFSSAGLRKMLLTRHSFYKPWAMKFPCNKSIGFHILTQGELFVRSPQLKNPIHMKAGDVIMIKRGLDHELATGLHTKVTEQDQNTTAKVEGEKPLATVVCGLYQFQTEPIHPLFKEIPDFIIIRSEEILSHHPLYLAKQLLSSELDQEQLGAESITKSLLDIIFNYIFRDWINKSGAECSSWSNALKDIQISKALSAIHSDLKKDWSVDELAHVASLSRAAFASKFRKLTGDTPAKYISRVRIQKAMDMLRSSSDGLESIAEEIGYNDSFTLSKAFKRIMGISPKEYRQQLLHS